MKTIHTTDPFEAADVIRRGGTVAFPTETVYGLGANALDAAAVAAIFAAKQRPADNPLIVHIGNVGQLPEVVDEVTPIARRLMDAFFPGPLTCVLPKAAGVPDVATAGLETVGVRMPRLDLARRFLEACGVPVAAPSANLSGRPSPTTWQAVAEDLDGRIDCILQGELTEVGLESTVVDCTGDRAVILRAGSIAAEEIARVVEVGSSAEPSQVLRSPGTRHRHYQPEARVILIEHPDAVEQAAGTGYIGLARSTVPFDHQLICSDVADYARRFYEFLRECDRRGIHTIYCQEVEETGVGAAQIGRAHV